MKTYFKLPTSFLLLTVVALFSTMLEVNAQVIPEGVPKSFIEHRTFDTLDSLTPTYPLPFIDNQREDSKAQNILKAQCPDCSKLYYGKGVSVSVNITSDGLLTTLPNGDRIWRYKFESPSAYALQFYFNEFNIPEGATLHAYSEDRSHVFGAFTYDNNPPDPTEEIKLAIQPVRGNTIFLEYYEPVGASFSGILEIENVIHVFVDAFNYSGPFVGDPNNLEDCHKNVSCSVAQGWDREVSSVALILYYDEDYGYSGQCTGALLNNTDENGDPIFLTAQHCAAKNGPKYDYNTWLFLFNHHAAECNEEGWVSTSTGMAVNGSILLEEDASGIATSADFLLLRLNTSVTYLTSLKVCYAGWDSSADVDELPKYVGIHHPLSDLKKFASGDHDLTTHPYANNQWVVEFDNGVTQPGSSGSPLFSSQKKIVGQLKGPMVGINCPPFSRQRYGKFYKSWTQGGLDFWLDPYNTGATSVNTYCPVQPDPIAYTGGAGGCTAAVSEGMVINGNTDVNAVACVSGDIILKPYKPKSCESILWKWNVVRKEYKCGSIPSGTDDDECHWKSIINPFKCYCYYNQYKISIREVDQNLNPIGATFQKWFSFQEDKNLSGTGPDWPYIYYNSMTIDGNVLSQLGATLVNGKYYKITLTTPGSPAHSSGSRVFRYCPENLFPSGNITSSTYAYDRLHISNATVNQDLNFIAGNTIDITSTTNLTRGYYGIEQDMCDPSTGYPWGIPYDDEPEISGNRNSIHQEVIKSNGKVKENLFQIYPNPTSNELTLDFALKTKTPLSVQILDSKGTLIRSIMNAEMKNIGYHKLNLNVSNLPDGMYVVVFQTPDDFQSRKLRIQ